MHRGGLHIVPRAELLSGEDGSPILSDAVNYVRANHTITAASAQVQRAIEHRLSGYCNTAQLLFNWRTFS